MRKGVRVCRPRRRRGAGRVNRRHPTPSPRRGRPGQRSLPAKDPVPGPTLPDDPSTPLVVHGAAALLGLALGLLTSTLPAAVEQVIAAVEAPAPPAPVRVSALSAILACVAAGIRLPYQLAVLAFRDFARTHPPATSGPTGLAGPDRVLALLVLSIVALACGLFVAVLPAWGEIIGEFYGVLCNAWVWSNPTLVTLHWTLGLLIGIGPCLLLGFGVACVDRLSVGPSRNPFPVIGVAGGAATGLTLAELWTSAGLQPGLLQRAVALPVLCLAVVTAFAATGSRSAVSSDAPASAHVGGPVRTNPRLLRLAVVAIGIVSMVVPAIVVRGGQVRGGWVAGVVLLGLSGGAAVAPVLGRAFGSFANLGGASCLAGVGVALAGLLNAAGPLATCLWATFFGTTMGWAGAMGWGAVQSFGAGGRHRTRLLTRTLFCASMGLMMVPAATTWAGGATILSLLAAAFITMGLLFSLDRVLPFARRHLAICATAVGSNGSIFRVRRRT